MEYLIFPEERAGTCDKYCTARFLDDCPSCFKQCPTNAIGCVFPMVPGNVPTVIPPINA